MDVLIVEDDVLHRAYLNEVVRNALPECARVLEAENGKVGEKLARENRTAHIVMDLQMNERNGIEAARTIWKERPDTRILFWSNYADEAYVRGVSRIVPEGAAYGYVLKSASDERLRLALRGIFIEAQCVIDREVRGLQEKSLGKVNGVSDSEYEILIDIALGLTDKTIARRRNLSLRSVQNRLQALYEKLNVYQATGEDEPDGRYNLRTRAVTIAILRKLLNYNALEKAEKDLAEWVSHH
ncbi:MULTISPECIES: response regulator transcription factor [unclassified Agrobacterium]|jgi:DNA-binding NarL/FixJ family response regulator|uniref:response regulator transcription factor n=1 Tax=unclassified Agrobacterium TaxID=2632611 RepID=UPI00177DD569|nr:MULTISPECIES: response regulator transcription factor [unclassified Agrobacterium]MBD9388134.1 response regulator transcription factor [Agrobacterium sp. AGB01]MDO5897828.1 response regulator transcription factor [Agrobacterium sp. Azo12]